MIFTSFVFLFFFLILLFVLFAVRDDLYRKYVLLVASYVFYGASNVNYLLLIFTCSLWAWGLGWLMYLSDKPRDKKIYLIASLILSLATLSYYKYFNFFSENLSNLFGLQWQSAEIILPVGISFFVFQTMSYTIDLYRGNIQVCKNLPKFLLFVSFFPQLVAGPIVRASIFLPQLERKIVLSLNNFIIGGQIFIGGAIQKVLIADNLSIFVDPIFSDPKLYDAATLWLAAFAYAVNIFCDFSGYSLMAIGIAKTLNFDLPKNFNMPYLATSITDFWRRWHITLSQWLRDYLYIPLGGNSKGQWNTQFNLMATMVLGGLWHGASWNFVLWGAMHGIGLVVHKLWVGWDHPVRKIAIYPLLAWSFTMVFVVLLWIPFRSQDFSTTLIYYAGLFEWGDGINWMHSTALVVLSVTALWHLMDKMEMNVLAQFPSKELYRLLPLSLVSAGLMLILLFAPLNTSPFIYFQF